MGRVKLAVIYLGKSMRLKLNFTSVFFQRRVRRGGEERHASKRKRIPRWEDPVTVNSLPAVINGIPMCYEKVQIIWRIQFIKK